MKLKVLVVGIIKKGNQILLRKKPDGSPPYKETWYLFSGELLESLTSERVIQEAVQKQTGITIKLTKQLTWDTEIKKDIDGEVKNFVYLDVECEYISGELKAAEGIERLEWVEIEDLNKYDHVPPSKVLLRKLDYLK